MKYQEILEKLYSWEREIAETIADNYFQTPEEFLGEVQKSGDRLQEAIHEWADGEVSVYTTDRYTWAAENPKHISDFEDEAIGNGTKTIGDMIAWCWYRSKEEAANNVIAKIEEML